MYEEDAVSKRVCQNFAKFHAGDTTCGDRECSGRPLMIDDQIKSLIENNPHYTRDNRRITKDRCKPFTHTHTWLSRHDIWVPHNLSNKNLMDRISICDLLLKRNENCPFF